MEVRRLSGENQSNINLLRQYLPQLQENMNVVEVTTYLADEGLLEMDEVEDIIIKADNDRKSAASALVSRLAKSRDPDWFSKFKTALKNSGQQIIYKLLSEEDADNEEGFKRILRSNFSFLVKTIKPIQLLPELYQRGTITELDMEEIEAKVKNSGNFSGALKLLITIPRRKNGWFTDFVIALKKENYKTVLNLFDPKFLNANSDESIDRYANECVKSNVLVTSSERQTANNEAKKSCDNVVTKLSLLTVKDDSSSKSRNTCDIFQSKVDDAINRLEDDSEASSGIVNLKADDEFGELNASSLCQVNSRSSLNSVLFRREQQFPGDSSASKTKSAWNAEKRNEFISRTNSGTEQHRQHFSIGASSLRPEINLRSECISQTDDWSLGPVNQLSRDRNFHDTPFSSSSRNYGGHWADDAEYEPMEGRGISALRHRQATNQIRGSEWNFSPPNQNAYRERETPDTPRFFEERQKPKSSRREEIQLRCLRCDSKGVWICDLRTILKIHHVVLDPGFKDLIKAKPHPEPNKFDGIKKIEKIYCKNCDCDWGIGALYGNAKIYVLKICGFVVEDKEHRRSKYTKWRQTPFQVEELTPKDRRSLQLNFPHSSF